MTDKKKHKNEEPQELTVQESIQKILQRWGAVIWDFVDYMGGVALLGVRNFQVLFVYPLDFRYIIKQAYEIGVKSFTLTSLVAIFTGMVMALQLIVGLKRFGLELYTGQIVGVAITRELGPVLTALMMASRVGSGIAAEIGSMEVSEQILAIRAMGGSPIAKLVVPRILVTMVVTPILTVMSICIGIVGGMIVTMSEAGITSRFYFDQIKSTVQVYDFLSGVGKTIFFGFFIGAIACYQGLNTTKGTKGVGDATTKTVVICSIVIFISDFFLTKLFLLF
ncbi:MAG: ABC transporter permease [bacterium]|nr:ABC transporter permease [bacterium]MBU1918702.1 ABC transporter permease [bacterium]